MKATKMGERFFDSSRGRIVLLLRRRSMTVNELAEELSLTDNAVRAHLLSLERDRLVRQSGTQRGTRKPHFAYELTDEAEDLFPKAYDALVNELISVLKGRLSQKSLDDVLREVGSALAARAAPVERAGNLESRVEKVLSVLEILGGSARFEREGKLFVVRSGSCPLAAAVATHPEVCKLAEALVERIVGVPVQEKCNREVTPRCRFEISGPAKARGR
jgi:predicted ArsR family transcriptional regulator